MTNVKRFRVGLLGEETAVVWREGRADCVVVDPGAARESECDALDAFLRENALKPAAVLLTHGHFDHVYDCRRLQTAYDIPVYLNPKDSALLEEFTHNTAHFGFDKPDIRFRTTDALDGDLIDAAGISWKVITTPGHSPGSVCYYDAEDDILMSGDTLFAGTIGRTDLAYGEYDDEIRSIMEKLIVLPGRTLVYPGHGPSTTIAAEREGNPLLEPFNEPEEEPDPDAPAIMLSGR